MKKFVVCLMLLLLLICPRPISVARAAEAPDNLALDYAKEFVEYSATTKTRVDRRAGTEGEKLAANYISQKLAGFGLSPKVGKSYADGVQNFSFVNNSGNKAFSQNVVYQKAGTSQKTIIFATNYDNNYNTSGKDNVFDTQEDNDYSEGFNASAASVGTLLALASNLSELPYSVEFAFLGASYQNNSGAKFYSQTLTQEERKNIILVVDVSKIALGSDIYYYTGNFGKTSELTKMLDSSAKKFVTGFSGASYSSAQTPLGYENAGYTGTTSVFENQDLAILHLFAGTYNSGLFAGECEYNIGQIETNTKNDSIDKLNQIYGTKYTKNLSTATSILSKIVSTSNLENMVKVSSGPYDMLIYGQYHLLALIILILLLAIVSVVIHYNLTKKAFNYVRNNKIAAFKLDFSDIEKIDKEKDKEE